MAILIGIKEHTVEMTPRQDQSVISQIPVLAITRAIMPGILARLMNSRAPARERWRVTASRIKASSEACAVLVMRTGRALTPVACLNVSLLLVI